MMYAGRKLGPNLFHVLINVPKTVINWSRGITKYVKNLGANVSCIMGTRNALVN